MSSQKLLPLFRSCHAQLTQLNQFKFGESANRGVERDRFSDICGEVFADLLSIGETCTELGVSSLANLRAFSSDLNKAVDQSARLLFQPLSTNLCLFLSTYAECNVDTTGHALSEEWCMVRSGYEFLLDIFRDHPIDSDRGRLVNKGVDQLRVYRDDFDLYLRRWHSQAYDINPDRVPAHLPSTHWWWRIDN